MEKISTIQTGKIDANASSHQGRYPFFTCGEEILRTENYAFDTDAVLLAGNGNFSLKYYKGKFNAYQRTYVIQPIQIDLKMLFYLLLAYITQITKSARGSTIKYLRYGDIAGCQFPLPPLNEQRRIVAKIEALFSELENGVVQLTLTQAKLKQYRQALLKTAFNGNLTADWRAKQNSPHVERSETSPQTPERHSERSEGPRRTSKNL
jgi:type I restriction enzyme S subunit